MTLRYHQLSETGKLVSRPSWRTASSKY